MLTIPFFSIWLILFSWTATVLLLMWWDQQKRQPALALNNIRK